MTKYVTNDLYYAQGDVLLRRIDDRKVSGKLVMPDPDGAVVLARGEVTGHRHAFYDRVTMFRDDALARAEKIPDGLYIGHVKLDKAVALKHEEHDAIELPKGTYEVRRQAEYPARETRRIVAD